MIYVFPRNSEGFSNFKYFQSFFLFKHRKLQRRKSKQSVSILQLLVCLILAFLFMALNSEVEMSKSISRNPPGNFTNGQPRTSQNLTKRVLRSLKKFLDSRESSFYWIFTFLSLISTGSDSFFSYSFKVNDLKICLELEGHAAIAAVVCRTVFDLLIILPCIIERRKEGDTVLKRQKWLYFWLDVILSNFPLPQLAVISVMIGRKRSCTAFSALRMLKYLIIFQYLPRVFRIYRFYRQAESTEGILTQHIWVNVSCCFLIYPLNGQILGGLCHLLAIERLTECWRLVGNTIICTMEVGTTAFDFGMLQEVILSGILEKDSMQKFMFCFNWGLQTIRSLGGNFNTSTDVWENLFAVFIYLFCVILINVLVLGKLQILLLSELKRIVDMRLRVQEIIRFKTFKMLSTNLQEQIKTHLYHVWQETGVVDGQHFLSILPSGLQEEILRELCLDMLKKVYVFKRFDEKILEEMYSYLKPKFYAERRSIVRKNERIKEMIFIIHGTILSTMTANDSSCEGEEYRDGEFWGQEIAVSCFHPRWNLAPMSKGNVRAATKVQAFALKLDDIKKALEKISKLPNRYSEQWRAKNARIIQTAWCTYKKKKKCSIMFDYRIPKAGLESCSVGAAAMDSPLQTNGLPIIVYTPERVGCVVVDRDGQCAAATSTGGMMSKMSGRIGESSLIRVGACADELCAVSCTGEGEAIIRGTLAGDVATVMEYKGLKLEEAVDLSYKRKA